MRETLPIQPGNWETLNEYLAELENRFAPAARMPAEPTRTFVTTFQTGHGWTTNGAPGANTNLNDTSDFTMGSQAAKVESDGAGGSIGLGKVGGAAIDMTGRMFECWVKVDDPTHLVSINLYAGDTAFTNYSLLNIVSVGASSAIKAGEWVRFRFGWNNPSVVGAPNRAAVTDLRFRLQDDNTGNRVIAHYGGLAHMADPTQFPNGVCSITFDHAYTSVYTDARKKMSQYGYPGTVYITRDQVGASGFMTLTQLRDLRDNHGWEVASHTDTFAAHETRFSNLTTAQIELEARANKDYLSRNGLGSGDHFAWPGGQPADWSVASEETLRQFFRSGRLTTDWPRQKWPPAKPMRLGCYSLIGQSVANVQTEIDRAVTNKEWFIVYCHTVGAGGEVTAADFSTIVDYLNTKGMAVRTVGDVFAS